MEQVNQGAGVPAEVLGDDDKSLKAKIRKLEKDNAALRAKAKAPEQDKDAPGVASASQASTKARYAIIVEEGNEQHSLPFVPVQVNGRAYQITRGQRVEVPPEVIGVLENAVVNKSIPQVDANGMPAGIITRPMRRYPFQNLGLAIDANGKRLMPEEQAA
jgi:hypothetical protein